MATHTNENIIEIIPRNPMKLSKCWSNIQNFVPIEFSCDIIFNSQTHTHKHNSYVLLISFSSQAHELSFFFNHTSFYPFIYVLHLRSESKIANTIITYRPWEMSAPLRCNHNIVESAFTLGPKCFERFLLHI